MSLPEFWETHPASDRQGLDRRAHSRRSHSGLTPCPEGQLRTGPVSYQGAHLPTVKLGFQKLRGQSITEIAY